VIAQAKTPLEEQLARLPDAPGVYKFYDARGTLLYVGKAKSLRSRVRSYFLKTATLEPHKRQMVTEIADIQYLLAETPTQSLVWEADLVRSERPRYNVKLRDDKHYPYIRINVQEPWPKTMVARRMQRDGARYFGPFTDATSVRQTLDTINRLFPHILCNRVITGNDPRACLYYHIKRCPAPCIGAIDNTDYRAIIDQMVAFLDGKADDALAQMRKEMEEAAEQLEFERAADLRDRIRAAEKVVTQQQIVYTSLADEDIVGVCRQGVYSCVQVFLIRTGRLIGREHFVLEGPGDDDEAEVLTSFVEQYYSQSTDVPQEVVLPRLIEDVEATRTWLTERRREQGARGRVRITAPTAGEKRRLVELATENAREVLERLQAGRPGADDGRGGRAPGSAAAAAAAASDRVLRHFARAGHQPGGQHGGLRERAAAALRLPPLQDQAPGREQRLSLDAGGHRPTLPAGAHRAIAARGRGGLLGVGRRG
jgi:excinuclease ABC subunit C